MYVSLEGNDGAGKSLAHDTVEEFFESIGVPTYSCREPGNPNDPVCTIIRNLLTDSTYADKDFLTEHYLFLADRSQNIRKHVMPALSAGKVVIQDRGIDSTTAYQAYGNGLDPRMVAKNQYEATCGIYPDLTIWLDVEPEIGLARAGIDTKRKDPDFRETLFEDRGLSYQQRVHNGYVQIWKDNPDRVKRVDANQPPDDVKKDIIKILKEAWAKRQEELNGYK